MTGFLVFSYMVRDACTIILLRLNDLETHVTLYSGAPLLYMVLCVPLGLVIPHESGYGYGYIQAANDSTDSTSEAV